MLTAHRVPSRWSGSGHRTGVDQGDGRAGRRLRAFADLAELVQAQKLILVLQIGLLANFVGLWIATPSTWRLVMVAGYAPLVLVVLVLFRRESRRTRVFLDSYPDPRTGSGASG